MTQISLTSGEILDIISALEDRENHAYDEQNNPHLAAYYMNLASQFYRIHDRMKYLVPENRVANLVLAAN